MFLGEHDIVRCQGCGGRLDDDEENVQGADGTYCQTCWTTKQSLPAKVTEDTKSGSEGPLISVVVGGLLGSALGVGVWWGVVTGIGLWSHALSLVIGFLTYKAISVVSDRRDDLTQLLGGTFTVLGVLVAEWLSFVYVLSFEEGEGMSLVPSIDYLGDFLVFEMGIWGFFWLAVGAALAWRMLDERRALSPHAGPPL